MENDFTGGRITNRLELAPHEFMEGFWQINGKDGNVAAMAEPGDITRLALMVLERMGDRREELPALSWANVPDTVLELTKMYRDDRAQRATMGGILMAAGMEMIRRAREEARGQDILLDGDVKFGGNMTELPFRLEIES